jgi:hypothetical protein
MKRTIIMLSAVSTFFLVWMLTSSFFWIFTTDILFKDIVMNPAMIGFMLIFGWIPAVIVGVDLDDKL